MTREEEIKQAVKNNLDVSVYTPQDGEMLKETFYIGAKWADANPKSPWISVEDDLPCNHEEMVVSSGIEEKDTLIVLVRFAVGFVDFAYMYYSNNEWRWNTYFKVSHWMLVPKFREE